QPAAKNAGSGTRAATTAGVRKMPLPIVEPTSTATALTRPSFLGSRSPQRSACSVMARREPFSPLIALKRLAWLAVLAAYFQIVLGQVVRVTGSGLGCGPNWPLCNGHLIPPLDDIGTVIEYGHRLSAVVLGTSILALVTLAWIRRGLDGGRVLR